MRVPAGFRQRPCPVCGPGVEAELYAESNYDPARVSQFSFASRKLPELMHYRLLRCSNCDVVYASPAPKLGALAKAYEEAAFDSQEEAGYAADSYAAHLPALSQRRGALDIGTGDGAFLARLLDAGFEGVQGVEPSTAPIKAAAPRVRKLIRHGLFKPGAYKASSLSLVSCFQTMEHVDAPAGIARAAFRLLRPGGAFYTVCHSHRSLSAKLLGRRSPIFDIEHLQLFSPQSLRRLLENAGFKDVQVRYINNRYPLHYWLKVFPLPGALKGPMIGAAKVLGSSHWPIPLPAGNLIGFGYRP
jgi:SAM-dependent methyltransferase